MGMCMHNFCIEQVAKYKLASWIIQNYTTNKLSKLDASGYITKTFANGPESNNAITECYEMFILVLTVVYICLKKGLVASKRLI